MINATSQHGLFKRTSDYYTNSDDDSKEVLQLPVSRQTTLEQEDYGQYPEEIPGEAQSEIQDTPSENLPSNICFQLSKFGELHGETIAIPREVFTENIGMYAEFVGRGSFGKVFKYPKETTANPVVALKEIYLGLDQSESSRTHRDNVMKEVETHRTLDHPNIVRYIGSHETESSIYIVMEYLPKGSLYSKLNDLVDPSIPALAEATILRYSKQILAGLVYLHSYTENPYNRASIIHRDLRAANILIDDNDNLKLADFGISKQLEPLATQSQFHTCEIGNLFWRSPEMLTEDQEKIGRKVDVWSLGITILEMVFVKLPFGLTKIRYLRLIDDQDKFENELCKHTEKINSNILVSLINECLTYDGNKRSTSVVLHRSISI